MIDLKMKSYSFNASVAMEVGGVNEAVMLQNIVYWVERNKANNKHCHEGRYWTFNSVKAYGELFPFWSTQQLRTIFKHLIDNGYLLEGNYNELKFDRTKWYTLSDKGLALFVASDKSMFVDSNKSELLAAANEICCNQQSNTIYKTTNINTNINNIGATPPKKRKATPFIPPTYEDVEAYCKESKRNINIQDFLDYYSSADWHDSKGQPVRNWKQRVVTWAGRNTNGGNNARPEPVNHIRPAQPHQCDLEAVARYYAEHGM